MQLKVFLGTGGVGKTSVAAATALKAALAGRKCLVLTIDPARRLQTALRLEGGGPERVPLETTSGGELWAEMLDVRATLTEAVQLHSKPDLAERILKHPIFASIANSLGGMQELMAVERIDQLMRRGFDNIVVDTAPSRHALEFLEKPEYFAQLAGSHWVKLVGRTYKFVERTGMLSLGRKTVDVYARVEEILGASLVRQVLDFYSLFVGNAEGYALRAEHTLKLLRDPAISDFCVVTTPQKALRDAQYFSKELQQRRFTLGAYYVNRVWETAPSSGHTEGITGDLLDWYSEIRESHMQAIVGLKAFTSSPVNVLPELAQDVGGLETLQPLAARLP
ncbi:MAG: ArsA-related P-loop ATPase [Bryobacteraceae bacterium]